MKKSHFEMQIDNNQLFQPLTEMAQQSIKGGQAGGDDDDIPDEIIWDVAGGTIGIKNDDDGIDIILYDIADVA